MIVHLFQNVVDLGEKVARGQLPIPEAPGFIADFFDLYIPRLQWLPYFWRYAMDKLRAKLNRSTENRIASREHPATDSVACLENGEGNSGTPEFNRSRQSGGSCADYDDTRSFRHDKILRQRENN